MLPRAVLSGTGTCVGTCDLVFPVVNATRGYVFIESAADALRGAWRLPSNMNKPVAPNTGSGCRARAVKAGQDFLPMGKVGELE